MISAQISTGRIRRIKRLCALEVMEFVQRKGVHESVWCLQYVCDRRRRSPLTLTKREFEELLTLGAVGPTDTGGYQWLGGDELGVMGDTRCPVISAHTQAKGWMQILNDPLLQCSLTERHLQAFLVFIQDMHCSESSIGMAMDWEKLALGRIDMSYASHNEPLSRTGREARVQALRRDLGDADFDLLFDAGVKEVSLEKLGRRHGFTRRTLKLALLQAIDRLAEVYDNKVKGGRRAA